MKTPQDGELLEFYEDLDVVIEGRDLKILKTSDQSAGNYTCLATNPAGEFMLNFTLKVYSKFHKNLCYFSDLYNFLSYQSFSKRFSIKDTFINLL